MDCDDDSRCDQSRQDIVEHDRMMSMLHADSKGRHNWHLVHAPTHKTQKVRKCAAAGVLLVSRALVVASFKEFEARVSEEASIKVSPSQVEIFRLCSR